MRRVAKTVNFGIIYGISPYGLSSQLGVSQQEARKYIDAYFTKFQGVKGFLDRTIAEAKEKGYVTTLLGRRRPIVELQSGDQTQRSMGERMAMNTPIQGTAADVIKLAMLAVRGRLQAEGAAAKMILQVHDELIFEVAGGANEGVRKGGVEEMERGVKLAGERHGEQGGRRERGEDPPTRILPLVPRLQAVVHTG